MPNFSTATISPEAAGLGNTLQMLALMSQLQIEQYEELKAGIVTLGQASKTMGYATENSMERDAESTRQNGFGSIAGGAANIGGEITSFGYGAYKNYRLNQNTDAQLKDIQEMSEEVAKPKSQDGAEIELRNLAEDDQDTTEEIKRKLAKGQKNLEKFGKLNPSDSEELKQAIADARQKSMTPDLDQFSEGLDKLEEKAIDQKRAAASHIERGEQRIGTISQSIGQMISGGMALRAAEAKRDQASQELLKSQTTFVYDTMKGANQTMEGNTQSTDNNKRDAIRTLMEGLANANRV